MKIIRTSTIGLSLNLFCKGLFKELSEEGYEVVALSSPDKDLKEIGERERVRTLGVVMSRRISPLNDLKSLLKLIKIFKKEKPDLVQSITPKAGILSMIAAKISGVPIRLHTFTGLIFPTSRGLKRKILLTTDRITSLCATHIIAEGQGVRSDLINHHITKKNITVLGYGNLRGIDMKYYDRIPEVTAKALEIRKQWLAKTGNQDDPDSKPFVFIFVGRMVADKGIDNLVTSFSELIKEGRDVKLILVGEFEPDDPLRPETIDYIRNSKNIFSSGGWVKDVRPYLAAADFLVFPSRREGFPNVVLEAGAMGLPALVTDINGSREIISDGLNGRVIPPDNIKALTDAMRNLMDHQEETHKMASSARQIITERYEQSFVRSNLKKYYKEILSEPGSTFSS